MVTERNIVLMGFMGVGKSAVGEFVAARLNRRYVDLDAEIVKAAGKSIAEIFAASGEDGFRAWESRVAAALSASGGRVLATGGGIVLDPANVNALGERGILICLDASIESILRRVADDHGRPLLKNTDRRRRLHELFEARRHLYEALPYHIDTEGLSVEAVADRVIEIASSVPD